MGVVVWRLNALLLIADGADSGEAVQAHFDLEFCEQARQHVEAQARFGLCFGCFRGPYADLTEAPPERQEFLKVFHSRRL